jgi:hypothetical protein
LALRQRDGESKDSEQKYLQVQLRLMYSICYTMLEIIRREPAPSDTIEWNKLHLEFKEDLNSEYIIDLMDLTVAATQQQGHPTLPLKKVKTEKIFACLYFISIKIPESKKISLKKIDFFGLGESNRYTCPFDLKFL